MGRATALGLPLRRQCRFHIFETITDPIPFEMEPWWVVATRCLVCGDALPALEVNSFVRANAFDWAACMGEVAEAADHYTTLMTTLAQRAQGIRPVLRDFG